MTHHKTSSQKSIILYYINGFHLLNKYLYLFLFSALLSLLSIFRNDIRVLFNNQINFLINILFILIIIIQYSFRVSFPLFVQMMQNKQKLNINDFSNILINNIKRSILPIFSLIFVFVFFSFFISISLSILFGKNILTYQNLSNKMPFFAFISNILLYPFIAFFSIFFSIKEKGYYRSFISSFKFSVKNFKFILLGLIIDSILFSVYVFNNNQIQIINIFIIFYTYISLSITTSSLLYFQDHYKEKRS
jgi:hypothetical protein